LAFCGPYSIRLTIGVFLVAFVRAGRGRGCADGATGVRLRAESASPSSQLPLLTLPGGHVIYLNQFFSAGAFSQRLGQFSAFPCSPFLFPKGLAEYLGTTQIQYVGHAATSDLRNRLFAKILRQPIGFFQHHPPGRAAFNRQSTTSKKTRIALSEYLRTFPKGFTLMCFLSLMVGLSWKMALACGVVLAAGGSAVGKFWPQNSPVGRKQPEPPGRAEPDYSGDHQRQSRG